MIKKIIHAFTMLIIAFCNAQTGKVGIGTITPTNTLHVKSTANPLRLEGVQQTGDTYDGVLAQESNGVVKKLGTKSFSVPANNGSRILWALGTGSTTYGGAGTWVDGTYTNALMNRTPLLDTYNGFNHGPNYADNYYTVQADGLYFIFIFNLVNQNPGGSFNGTFGRVEIRLTVNGIEMTKEDHDIYDGSYIGGGTNYFSLNNSTTIWLKKNDKVEYQFATFNLDASPNVTMDWSSTHFLMYKLF